MGFFSGLKHVGGNIVNAVKKGAVDAGHGVGAALDNKYVKGAAALGLAATGVGAVPAALIMAGEGAAGNALKKGGNLTQVGRGALRGAAIGGVAGLAGAGTNLTQTGGQSFGGLRSAGSFLKNGVESAVSKVTGHGDQGGMVDQQGNPVDPTLPPGGPINGTRLPVVGSKSGGINWGDLAKTGIAAGTAYEGYQSQQQADAERKRALDLAQQQYDQAKPLRDASIAKLSNVQRPDLSGLFADGNPYKKKLPVVGYAA